MDSKTYRQNTNSPAQAQPSPHLNAEERLIWRLYGRHTPLPLPTLDPPLRPTQPAPAKEALCGIGELGGSTYRQTATSAEIQDKPANAPVKPRATAEQLERTRRLLAKVPRKAPGILSRKGLGAGPLHSRTGLPKQVNKGGRPPHRHQAAIRQLARDRLAEIEAAGEKVPVRKVFGHQIWDRAREIGIHDLKPCGHESAHGLPRLIQRICDDERRAWLQGAESQG